LTRLHTFEAYKFGYLAIPLEENGAPIGVALGYKHDLLPGEDRGRPVSHSKLKFENLGGDSRGMEIRKPLNAVSIGFNILVDFPEGGTQVPGVPYQGPRRR